MSLCDHHEKWPAGMPDGLELCPPPPPCRPSPFYGEG
jgi:hypothetical protein